MTWKAHVDYVCKKVPTRVITLGRVRRFVTKGAAILVNNALILLLFDYCDVSWSSLLQQDMDRLQRLPNRPAQKSNIFYTTRSQVFCTDPHQYHFAVILYGQVTKLSLTHAQLPKGFAIGRFRHQVTLKSNLIYNSDPT